MEPMLGMIFMVPWDWAPREYLKCQGQILDLRQYQALFSLVGNIYGGSIGQNTFGLPNLSGRTAIGTGRSTTGSAYNLAGVTGTETTTLSAANLAPHAHSATFRPTTGTQPVTIPATTGTQTATMYGVTDAPTSNSPASCLPATLAGTNKIYSNGTNKTAFAASAIKLDGPASTAQTSVNITTVTGGTVTVDPFGAATPFSNFQPSLALTFVIAVTGLYPNRPD
ncbi:phage tail protein [Methylobacterium indicum]|uniref:Tail protein n=1 Tax=Methylobacterium indicum TaxID=1775910 RepID=A0A8H8WQE0_9HYPH|nr:tail fiber protein [Methylobacterium indicum]BCM82425.1 tail protein [Methylobacterium indicum]